MGSKRVEEEYQVLLEENQWNLLYQGINLRSQSYPYTYVEAKKLENKQLNRYRDVNPYDHTRIILQKERFFTDYINASLVKMQRAGRRYILTQGPLVFTSGHFWLMVWEQNSPAIIMLNRIIEKTEHKCHWYWPHGNDEKFKVEYDDVNISIIQIEEIDYSYYTTRRFKVTNGETGESREVWHFHYTTWPDFEVPESPHAFLDFLQRVRDCGALDCKDGSGPAIVHCSAGIGRSGTFCLVDSVLLLIENEGQANVDIQDILLDMRRYRMGLIQTAEQLRFAYIAIVEGIHRLDPNYVPSAPINESVYSTVADEEELPPPPPPPRGESLGRPPKRPLPAIPSSVSMAEMGLYARRRARAASGGVPAFASTGGIPIICCTATSAIEAPQSEQQPPAADASVPTLALLSSTALMTPPTHYCDQRMAAEQQALLYGTSSVLLLTDGSVVDSLSLSDGLSDQESLTADPLLLVSTDESAVFDPYSDEDGLGDGTTTLSTASDALDFSNIDVSTNVDSEDSDRPPTPTPRDRQKSDAGRETPSPDSSASAVDDLLDEDDDTTETTESTENADTIETAVHLPGGGEVTSGDGVRKRRTLEERVADMKKRSREADRWHSFKRSLVKPLAWSVGLLAVAGIFIYAYAKH